MTVGEEGEIEKNNLGKGLMQEKPKPVLGNDISD